MLISEATKKACHMSMHSTNVHSCLTTGCMAWVELLEDVIDDRPNQPGGRKRVIGKKPKDPAEGYCSAIPPELECTGGGY